MTTQQYLDMIAQGTFPAMSDRISYGLTNALTVMLVVFAVLGILYLILSISGAIFAKTGNAQKKAKGESKTEKPETKQNDELIAVLTAAALAAREDGELVAAITAGIEAARADAGETNAFRVVSFRRR